MIKQKKKSYRSCSFDSSGWTVNFTKFSVHLHFNRTKVICKCVKDLGIISRLLLII